MRTTIDFDDGTLKRARQRAAALGTSLSALVVAAVRRELEAASKPKKKKPFRLVTFDGGGLSPGYEWSQLEHQTADLGPIAFTGKRGKRK